MGSSPVIVGDRVILHTGPAERVFVPAFDVTSGEERWRHEEPLDGNGERNSDGNYMGSWSTPVLTEMQWKGGCRLHNCHTSLRIRCADGKATGTPGA